MNDVNWCSAALRLVEERLLALRLFAGHFGRELEEAQVAWNDTAARDVFLRYLEPQRQDVEAEVLLLRQQLAVLAEVVRVMAEAEAPAAEIQRLSEEAALLRMQAENEARTAHRHADMALDGASAARDWAEQANGILAGIH
jgi:hypothetical protein